MDCSIPVRETYDTESEYNLFKDGKYLENLKNHWPWVEGALLHGVILFTYYYTSKHLLISIQFTHQQMHFLLNLKSLKFTLNYT
jgi:hypothetical protein